MNLKGGKFWKIPERDESRKNGEVVSLAKVPMQKSEETSFNLFHPFSKKNVTKIYKRKFD